MFDFTTTTLISSGGSLTNVKYPKMSDSNYKSAMKTAKESIKNAKVAFVSVGDSNEVKGLQVIGGPALYIDDEGEQQTTCKAYFRKYSLPKYDVATFELPAEMLPGDYRLYFDIIAPNSLDMEMVSKVEQFPRRDYMIQFSLPMKGVKSDGTPETYTDTEVSAIIETAMSKRAEKFDEYAMLEYGTFTAAVQGDGTDDPTPASFTISVTKPTRRFRHAELQSLDVVRPSGCSNHCVEEYVTVIKADVEHGDGGFGTYEYMIANYRLPTAEYNRAYPLLTDEKPVVGVNYNQFTVHMTTTGRKIGHEAVGALNTSKTTHVFFVADGTTSKEFADGLRAAEIKIDGVTAEDVVPS